MAKWPIFPRQILLFSRLNLLETVVGHQIHFTDDNELRDDTPTGVAFVQVIN